MTKLIAYSLAIVASLVTLSRAQPSGVIFDLSLALAVGFAIPLIDAAVSNWLRLRLAWYSLIMLKSKVRISYSYLFRIKVDNEYLLVRSERYDHYQPVGGVYKVHTGGAEFLARIGALSDDYLELDKVTDRDLRVRIEGRRIYGFANWVESQTGREVDGWREFYEELVGSGILSARNFPFVEYSFIRRRYHKIRYSQYVKSKELLIADILELEPSDEQKAELRELRRTGDSRVLFATDEKIDRLGAEPGKGSVHAIGEHTRWLLRD